MQARIARLAERVLDGELLDRDAAAYLTTVGGDDVYDLFYWANKIRIRFMGRDVKFCAIVAAKAGGCSEDCKFCAQSEHYTTAVGDQSKLTDQQVLRGISGDSELREGDDVSAAEWDERSWDAQHSARDRLLDLALDAVIRLSPS